MFRLSSPSLSGGDFPAVRLKMNFSLAHAMLNPGKSSLPHYLKESIEVYYILDGEGLMDINNETKKKG